MISIKTKILCIFIIFFLFFSINSMALEFIPLNPDALNQDNNINPIIDYYQNIEIFTKEQNKNNIQKKIKEKELIEKVNEDMFSIMLVKEDYNIEKEMKKYNIFNNKETKHTYTNEKQNNYNYELIIVFIIILILCILTYVFTKKLKNNKKGEKDEYNLYFTNK